jgi:hypothetical protein
VARSRATPNRSAGHTTISRSSVRLHGHEIEVTAVRKGRPGENAKTRRERRTRRPTGAALEPRPFPFAFASSPFRVFAFSVGSLSAPQIEVTLKKVGDDWFAVDIEMR